MEVKNLDERYYKKYELFVLSFNESLLYYSIKYKKLLEEYLKIDSNYLVVVDKDDNIQAILPLMKKMGKFGVVINSLPFYSSNGGILAKSDKALNLLLEYYNELCKNVAGSTYVMNPLIEEKNNINYNILDERIGQWTYISNKEEHEKNIMTSFHSKTRNMVRKAIKENITIEVDNSQIGFLYETHYENITSMGGKAKERRFFELIEKHFEKGKDYNIYIAKLGEKEIGALLLFYYNETVEYFTPAAIAEYRNFQATSLLVYESMIDASKNGYKWWNWGGTWASQDGVYRFKNRFGAVDKKYSYFIKINNKDIYKASKEELLEEYDNFYVIPFDKLKG